MLVLLLLAYFIIIADAPDSLAHSCLEGCVAPLNVSGLWPQVTLGVWPAPSSRTPIPPGPNSGFLFLLESPHLTYAHVFSVPELETIRRISD